MGSSQPHHNAPERKLVETGKTRLCVTGFKYCPPAGRSRRLVDCIVKNHPDKYEKWYYIDSGSCYYHFLDVTFKDKTFPEHLKGHATSPFNWIETNVDGNTHYEFIGPNTALIEWASKEFKDDKEIMEICSVGTHSIKDAFY